MTARVTSINDVAVVDAPPEEGWTRVSRDLRRPPTTKAMLMIYGERSIWVAKKHLVIFKGSYYARNFTLVEKPQQ